MVLFPCEHWHGWPQQYECLFIIIYRRLDLWSQLTTLPRRTFWLPRVLACVPPLLWARFEQLRCDTQGTVEGYSESASRKVNYPFSSKQSFLFLVWYLIKILYHRRLQGHFQARRSERSSAWEHLLKHVKIPRRLAMLEPEAGAQFCKVESPILLVQNGKPNFIQD